MSTDDDECAAREWLATAHHPESRRNNEHRATIQRLLDRPVLPKPEDVPNDLIEEMWTESAGHGGGKHGMEIALGLLYDHYTSPPAPAKVETWAAVSDTGVILFQSHDKAKVERAVGHLHYRVVKLVEATHADQ